MLHESLHYETATGTQWLPSGLARHGARYKLVANCETGGAPRIEALVLQSLKARGADIRVSRKPAASKSGARTLLCFAIAASPAARGNIAALVNQLGADPAVRAVRWESDPRAS
jgi:hypothetical protein